MTSRHIRPNSGLVQAVPPFTDINGRQASFLLG